MVEEVGFKENLAVGDRNHVGRNVSGNVTGLGLNDRQSRHGTSTCCIGETSRTLKKSGVKIEHITRECLTTRWAAKNEGNLTVSNSVLGKVIKHDQHVLTLIHQILTNRKPV